MLPEEMKHPHRQLALGGQALPCVAVLLLTALPCACADGDGMMKLPGWFLGAWGECDVSCGGGMQHRAVHCLGSYGQVAVLDLLCGAPPPEEDLSRPCNTHPCGNFYFEMGAWQACSEPCGGGTRGRATQCIAAGGGPASDESLCAGLEPNTAVWQSCNTAPCPQNVAYWSVGSWGICTAQCGPGFAYRTVSCMGTDGQPSAACKGPQPVAAKPCEITPCGEDTEPSRSWAIRCDRCMSLAPLLIS